MFRNASMTKAPATVGALQLVERGALELDATVESIVPEFGELQVLEGFDGDTPRLRTPASKATVRQLMNHTAGCGYEFCNENLHRYVELTDLPSLFEGRKACLMAPFSRDPGTLWEYGINTDWLGLVIEAVSGEKLDAYLAENLYGPLGMTDTTFFPTPEQRSRLMELKFRSPAGGSRHSSSNCRPSRNGHPRDTAPTGRSRTMGASFARCCGTASWTAHASLRPRPSSLHSANSWRVCRCPTA